jgi:ATP-binding cassette subfamily B (MDR/TAP) protein 1
LSTVKTYPILAYLFSSSFTDIGAAASEGLAQVRELAYTFLVLGVYALVCATIQTACFEVAATKATERLRLQWFHALLRQDPAFFDVYDVSGIASGVAPAANKYRRGVGRKFGEGVQFLTTGIGGLGYAMWASWRVALVVLAVTPFISISAVFVVSLNQSKSARASKAYSKAGSVAYASVSGIKTVLSLNAATTMIEQYKEATQEALRTATAVLIKQGFANGSMLGSFIMLYAVLALYGTALLYRDVADTGCDPSAGVPDNDTCTSSGPDVFGAMLGVAFAAQGISQVGNALETFSAARVSVASALKAIKRLPGEPEQIIYYDPEEEKDSSMSQTTSRSSHSVDMETPEGRVKAILPAYTIDSSSDKGLKPKKVAGEVFFDQVHFSYPTRPGHTILNGLTLDIPAGKTTALVGPSGGGKSSIVKQILRYYDPSGGSIKLDGKNLKDINVKYLRHIIGYVGQEPTLFATTIARNIQYGNPEATMEDIERAAKLANAHDFITSLPDGYETQVGDKGGQLSGGQKQRIAIARVLVADPKILLLDEATSALDAQSELVVQEALSNIIATQRRTTIISKSTIAFEGCKIVNWFIDDDQCCRLILYLLQLFNSKTFRVIGCAPQTNP